MNGTEIVIKIGIEYFLGIIATVTGTLIAIAWFGGARITAIETSIDWIKKQMDDIWESVKGGESQRALLEAHGSPVNPTERGWELLRNSGLVKIIDEERREWLVQHLGNSLKPNHTEYDVQETALRVMFSLRDDLIFGGVKKYAFDNGLDADLLLRLGSFLLRDNFLNRTHEVAPMPQAQSK